MKYQTLHQEIYGTKVRIKLIDKRADEILSQCNDLLFKYNLIFSMYDRDAELFKLNQSAFTEKFYASDELFELIYLSKKHSTDPYSKLNICIGPLVKLWNIGLDNVRLPSQEEIDEVLNHINLDNLIVDDQDRSIRFLDTRTQIDLGATSKGYIADRIMEFIKSQGVISALVDLGGNILTHGFNLDSPDLNWRIGLQDPNKPRGNHVMILEMNDLSIVTSGIYERKLEIDGKTYHHIFDSKTGYPIDSNMESISIIAKDSVLCDIWTSKLFAMDFESIEKILEKEDEIDAIAIYKGNNVKYTKAAEKYILWKEQRWKK